MAVLGMRHRGHHAAARRRHWHLPLIAAGTVTGIVLLEAAGIVLSALILLAIIAVLLYAAVIRVPPRIALWGGLLSAWPAGDGLRAAGILPAGVTALVFGASGMGCCAGGLLALKARRRRAWRERGGQLVRATRGRRAHEGLQDGRITENTDRLDGIEDKVDAVLTVLSGAYRAEGLPLPPALGGPAAQPGRRLYAVRDDVANGA
jgi:hypothetical protein